MDIVLVNPQIPQNTGTIARTCAATKTPLHIVGKTGFEITDKNVKRAGLDYWPYVTLHQHETWQDYLNFAKPNKVWLFSKFGTSPYHKADFDKNDALVFGSEISGLDKELVDQYDNSQLLLIPMLCKEVRSLNLSNCVSLAHYHALQHCNII